MKTGMNIAIAGLIAVASSGCTTSHDQLVRPEAITLGAGNSVAANTVLQMVDPWPAGVNDTDIESPADLKQHKEGVDEEAQNVATSQSSG